MGKGNRRRVSVIISSHTYKHLETIRQFCGYDNIGRVIDKLVREKQVELNEGVRDNATNECSNRRQNW